MSRSREPVSIGQGLKAVARRLGGKGLEAQAGITGVWNEAVGENISGHTYVVGIRRGELLVGVDSPVWASELSSMSERLIQRINETLGKTVVTSIRFTTSQSVERARVESSEQEEAASRYGPNPVEPVALTDEERAEVEASFRGVSDDKLRDAAVRAAIRDMEWKKGVRSAKEAQGGPESS